MKGASHIQGDTTHSSPRVSPSLATPLIICLSFTVLSNFFANMRVKKTCASPTKNLTARHWSGPWLKLVEYPGSKFQLRATDAFMF